MNLIQQSHDLLAEAQGSGVAGRRRAVRRPRQPEEEQQRDQTPIHGSCSGLRPAAATVPESSGEGREGRENTGGDDVEPQEEDVWGVRVSDVGGVSLRFLSPVCPWTPQSRMATTNVIISRDSDLEMECPASLHNAHLTKSILAAGREHLIVLSTESTTLLDMRGCELFVTIKKSYTH